MKNFLILLALGAIIVPVLIFSGSPVNAAIPRLINYQGMLTQSDGTTPVPNGNYSLTFKIYGSLSGTDSLWREYHSNVSVTNGLFNVILGSVTTLNLAFNTDYWLGIRVGNDPELSPRIRLTSVGYAYRALVADSAVKASSAPTGGGWTDEDSVVKLETTTDKVGIGTNQPSQPLHVVGPIRWQNVNGSVIGELNFDTEADLIGIGSTVGDTGAASLSLWAGGAERFRINQSGNVGISNSNPEARFHSEGSWILGITNSILPVHWGYGFNGWLTTDKGIRYEGAGDSVAHLFTTYGTGNIAEFGKSSGQGQEVTTEFVINNSGNVGIGTNQPSQPLHVVGPIRWQNVNGSVISELNFDTGADLISIGSSVGGMGAASLSLWAGGAERLRINQSGNVGIGTTTPSTKLAVYGLPSTSSYNYVKVNTATGDFYYQSSSKRYKEDVRPLEDDFQKILQVKPKSFVDKASGQREIGYIAEEFDRVGLNNLVIYDKEGQPDGLKYDLVSVYLLEVMRNQEEAIGELKAVNEELRRRIEALESK